MDIVHNLNRSCPNLGRKDLEEISELKDTLSQLQIKLKSADEQIDILIQENHNLKKQLSGNERKICNLTKIWKITTPKGTSSSIKKGKLVEHPTDQQNQSYTLLNVHQIESSPNKETNAREEDGKPLPNSFPKLKSKGRLRSIHIFGDQQVRGLSAKFWESICGKWNDVYNLSGLTKPDYPG